MPTDGSARSHGLRAFSTPDLLEPAAAAAAAERPAGPLSARLVDPAEYSVADSGELQQAVVALPVHIPAVTAEGSVVDDPAKAALRLIRDTFTPFVIVRTPTTLFVVHTKFGQGLSSIVYQVEDRIEDMFFALKVVPLCEPYLNETLGTAALLRRLKHKHILPCHDHFRFVTQGVPFLCLKLPFCPRGSLGDLLRWKGHSGGRISAAHIAGYIAQLASALQYLHQQGILHGDLRPDHVMLYTHHEEVRLIGLTDSVGLRCRSSGPVSVTGGRLLYAPPEWAESPFLGRVLHPTEVPLPSYDMWSLGCLLMELCTGKLLEDRQGLHGTPLALDTAAMESVRIQMQSVLRGVFASLGRGLLNPDAEARLSAEGAQDVLQSTDTKASSWSGVITKPFRRLKSHA